MGFILIGVILGLVFFGLFWTYMEKKYSDTFSDKLSSVLLCLNILVAILGIGAGLFVPTAHKPKEATETVELINLNDEVSVNGKNRLLYVTINPENTYTYYTQIDSEFADESSKAYVSNTISNKNNVTIVEEENCTNPRLVIYVEKAKITFWSFGIGEKRLYYVFYVPEDTVIHNFKLG